MKETNNKKSIILFSFIFLVILAGLAIIYANFRPQAAEGDKTIIVEVIIPEEETKEYTINTDAQYLRNALDEHNLIRGVNSDFGFYITEVNGRVSNEQNQEWWCITQQGEEILYGVNEIAIQDGDHYEITLMIGY